MTLDAHVTGIWCGQIGGGVGTIRDHISPIRGTRRVLATKQKKVEICGYSFFNF